MTGTTEVPLWEGVVRFTPSRVLNPTSYQSGGVGMVGTAGDLLKFLEVLRNGGTPILSETTVAAMTKDQVGPQAQAQGPGWGFGYGGWAVLDDPVPTGTPQAKGTIQWGGLYGHSWFTDPNAQLKVVALTNTAFEGMIGAFPTDVRNAAYHAIARFRQA